jgi:hypothetical protein
MVARKQKASGWGGPRPGSGRKAQFEDSADRTIRFERAQLEELENVAAEKDVTTADLVREAVATYLTRRRRK